MSPLVWLAHELQQGRDVDCGFFDTRVWAESMGGDAPALSPQSRITEYVVHGWRAPWPSSWQGVREPSYEVDDNWNSGPLLDNDRPGLSVIIPVHRLGPPMDRCVRSLAGQLREVDEVIVVLDTGGHIVCAKREDGSGIIRYEIAVAKAYGALGMGWGSRTSMERATQNPNFFAAIEAASGGRIVPNPGGVLIRDAANVIVGAVGISGDTGDNDEIIAVAGIEAAGLKADPGGSKK